jgi:hypothetical protein
MSPKRKTLLYVMAACSSLFASLPVYADGTWVCTTQEKVPSGIRTNGVKLRLKHQAPGFDIRPDDPDYTWQILQNTSDGLIAARGDTASPVWGTGRGPSQVRASIILLDKNLGDMIDMTLTPTDKYLDTGPWRGHCTELK